MLKRLKRVFGGNNNQENKSLLGNNKNKNKDHTIFESIDDDDVFENTGTEAKSNNTGIKANPIPDLEAANDQVANNQVLAADNEVEEEKPSTSRCSKKRGLIAFSLALLALGGAGYAGYKFWPNSSSDNNTPDKPTPPYVPLTECPWVNATDSKFGFIPLMNNTEPFSRGGYDLKSVHTPTTPREKANANDLYYVFQTTITNATIGNITMGDIMISAGQILGKTPEQAAARGINGTYVLDYNPQGVLTTLPGSASQELVCIYNALFGFPPTDEDDITNFEIIIYKICRAAEDSVCNQLGTQYINNENLIALSNLRRNNPTPYVTNTGSEITTRPFSDDDQIEPTPTSVTYRR